MLPVQLHQSMCNLRHCRQLGVVKYLSERFDLTDPRLAFLGASAGSLMVVLAACGVPAGQMLQRFAGPHLIDAGCITYTAPHRQTLRCYCAAPDHINFLLRETMQTSQMRARASASAILLLNSS